MRLTADMKSYIDKFCEVDHHGAIKMGENQIGLLIKSEITGDIFANLYKNRICKLDKGMSTGLSLDDGKWHSLSSEGEIVE